jgi:hypothetical protein
MKIWHQRIVDAGTWKELLDAAREYLASLTPHEWASIPRNCRPDRIKGIDDLEFWHRRLAEEYLELAATAQTTDMHRAMLAFFTAAAERAGELYGDALPHDEDAVNDRADALREQRKDRA